MPPNIQHIVDLAVTLFAFGLVLALWLAGAVLWLRHRAARQRRLEERLELHQAEGAGGRTLRLWKDGEEATTVVPGRSRRRSLYEWVEQLCTNAGFQASVPAVAAGALGIVTLLFLGALMLTGSALAGLATIAAAAAILWTYIQQRTRAASALFERQLVDALDLAARSLRAGHPLVGAFRLVSEEIGPPVRPVFADICQQQSLGVSFENALRNAANRSDSMDMKLFATSVIIQLRTGGNLTDMMDRVAAVIRDRLRLSGRIRTLTAQTQLSKRILIALPIVLFALLCVIRPDYMQPLYTTGTGQMLLAGGGVTLLVGAWLMNRMAVLRY